MSELVTALEYFALGREQRSEYEQEQFHRETGWRAPADPRFDGCDNARRVAAGRFSDWKERHREEQRERLAQGIAEWPEAAVVERVAAAARAWTLQNRRMAALTADVQDEDELAEVTGTDMFEKELRRQAELELDLSTALEEAFPC